MPPSMAANTASMPSLSHMLRNTPPKEEAPKPSCDKVESRGILFVLLSRFLKVAVPKAKVSDHRLLHVLSYIRQHVCSPIDIKQAGRHDSPAIPRPAFRLRRNGAVGQGSRRIKNTPRDTSLSISWGELA